MNSFPNSLTKKFISDLKNKELIDITNDDEFYFQKGQDALKQWLEMEIDNELKISLLELTLDYQNFKQYNAGDERIEKIRNLLFTIVSYLDFRSNQKRKFNQYDDKRTIAHAYVRMNYWIKHLLTLKFKEEKLQVGNTKNAFEYILNPTTEINILSENHRRLIARNILKTEYVPQSFTTQLINLFKPLIPQPTDNQNLTLFIERLLYINKDYWLKMEDQPNALETDIKKIMQSHIDQTEKERLILARIGQGDFRVNLIKLWNGCTISGYKEPALLIASHIKPWRDCENHEKLDPMNGLLLLPNFDKLFDRGFISFKDSGEILVSSKLSNPEFFDLEQIEPIAFHKEQLKYLKYHREKVFLK